MKNCVEDFAALVRKHDALLARLLREVRMLSQPIEFRRLRETPCHSGRRRVVLGAEPR